MDIKKFFQGLGPRNTVIVITLLAACGSVFLTWASYSAANLHYSAIHLWIAAFMAFVIAPTLCTPFIRQLFKIIALEAEVRRLASYDQLSNLMTRDAFMGSAESYIRLANRKHSNFALAFIDLDNFKLVNDRYGHVVGDTLVTDFGAIINALKRKSDLAGRYGGDEFIVLLPETNQQGAQAFADKVHTAVKQISLPTDLVRPEQNRAGPDDNSAPVVTITMGITMSPRSGNPASLDELINQADIALYQAKDTGKNCTQFYRHLSGTADATKQSSELSPTPDAQTS